MLSPYCLGKEINVYRSAPSRRSSRSRINACVPTKIMFDFEMGIIKACNTVFPDIAVSGYLFHLGKIVYRQVQAVELRAAYRNKQDQSISNNTHIC